MLLNQEIRQQVQQRFQELKDQVKLIVFTRSDNCRYCKENQQLMEEIAELSDKISVQVFDFQKDKQQVDQYSIDKVPAVAVTGKDDYGIRLYGMPSGYDFVSLLESIRLVSTGETELNSQESAGLANLTKDTHLQVFVSSGCPHCPSATMAAYQLARLSHKVKADMIDSSQFPDLAEKYKVSAVPHTVINETAHQVGAVPAAMLIQKINQS